MRTAEANAAGTNPTSPRDEPNLRSTGHQKEKDFSLPKSSASFSGGVADPPVGSLSSSESLPVLGFCPSNRSSIAPLLKQLRYLGTRADPFLQGTSTEEDSDVLRQETHEKSLSQIMRGERPAVICKLPFASFEEKFRTVEGPELYGRKSRSSASTRCLPFVCSRFYRSRSAQAYLGF